jgi:transposase InsO family protein
MLQIHPNARTTPVTRAEIARSKEPTGVLASRFGVSTETVRKWRKRGPQDCLDHSARPHKLPWKATEEERAVVCALRRATNFALDDLTFVVAHFLPHLNRDSVWRILRAEGLSRRPPPAPERPKRGQGEFRDYDLGFVHIDIKHLPKLRTADGERRKRYLFVAIDRRSRSVHLAVKDDETEKSAIAFLREAAAAFPFRLTHVLTDNGSCFTPAFARVCAELGAEYRHTKPYSPHTNGMVERFNGRVGSEVLGITIHSHRDLEHLLRGFNAAYNARRQRVLDGKTPDQVVAERLKARRKLVNAKPHGRAGPTDIARARLIAEAAKEVSQPDTRRPWRSAGAWSPWRPRDTRGPIAASWLARLPARPRATRSASPSRAARDRSCSRNAPARTLIRNGLVRLPHKARTSSASRRARRCRTCWTSGRASPLPPPRCSPSARCLGCWRRRNRTRRCRGGG